MTLHPLSIATLSALLMALHMPLLAGGQAGNLSVAQIADLPTLAGVKLHQVSNHAGGGSERIYRFCADGSYSYFYQSLSSGFSSSSKDAGLWQQSGDTLTLQSRKEIKTLSLRRMSALRIALNGSAYSLGRSGC